MASGCAPPKLQEYILTEKLGSGSYATVYKAYRKVNSREVVAIKCVSKKSLNKASVENLLTEIEILKAVKHPHIVQLKDFQWDGENIYLIMEYCAGGDLSHFIRSRRVLPERVVCRFLQQLASALQYLHQRHISHLDLKPQNILLSSQSSPHLKLADFGFAQHMSPWDEKRVLRGSPLYMAPEMVCRQQYDARVDLWSVGVILYESLFGRPPFASKSFVELEGKIRSSKAVELPAGSRVSPECRDLLLRLLERDPEQRMIFEEFFTHPFVDLDHMPDAGSLDKATALVQDAVQKDTQGDFASALSLYCRSLEYFVPALHYESDCRRKAAIRSKVTQYISRAEELKTLVAKGNKADFEQAKTKRDLLREMSQDKPRLLAALQMASAAVTQEAGGDDSVETLHLYQQSLGELLPMLAAESQGRRRVLLHAEIKSLMSRAEYLKEQLKMRENQKEATAVDQDPFSESIKSNCSLQ